MLKVLPKVFRSTLKSLYQLKGNYYKRQEIDTNAPKSFAVYLSS